MPEHTPALVFHTERQRAGTGEWLPDHRLVVRFEPGGAVPLAQLDWRDLDGAEAVAGFDPAMTTFTGVRTTPHGTSHAWRGRLAERLPDRPGHWFRVQGGEGEPEELRLLIEDGGAPAVRVTWADREGGGGAVVLRTLDLDEAREAGEVTGGVRDVRAGNEHRAAGEVALNLLDETSAKWLSWRDADRLEFTLAEPVHIRHYVLVSANDFADRDPRAWELSGSADGHTWATLDTRSDEFFPGRHLPRDFHVSGPEADTPYRYLRLEITRNCGGSELQLERVRFFSADRTYESFTGHRYAASQASAPFTGVVGDLVTGTPHSVEDWRSFLAEFSADMLRALDEGDLYTTSEEQRSASWLGYDGATEERIAALEHRLGRPLPPGYRAFLAASDGWSTMGAFMYSLRGTATVGWLADLADEALPEEYLEGEELVGPALLVSDEGDAQYWLLDAGDVSPDGEWAAYVWASWYPGLGERHRSFADLVVDERASFEELSGAEGRPVRPEGAEELLAQGRRAALNGWVDDALDTLRRAEEKGSGAAAYLRVVLSAFLDARATHHELRGLLRRPHVVAEIGTDQIRSEAVPLFLRAAGQDAAGNAAHAIRLLGEIVPDPDLPATVPDSEAWLAAHRAPEPPAFERALDTARDLAARGATDDAWAVIEKALPEWYPPAPHRIAPVVLLTDPALKEVVTPRRAREAVFTPKGERPTAEG
ncbi:SMI1/KNR4 family protein [Nocardiopsis aegyptia]|uniref:SMI1/KNR4 family protein n=1 Tax=Nocardiopsis aegyptia TaxID=220378 RepID=UPI0036733E8C